MPRREPPLRRWLDDPEFSLDTRYRFTADNQDALSANQLQYKESLRARFNLDPGKRYTVNVGYFTGNSFGSAWDNWGVGNHTAFDRTHNYLKQLYASATPCPRAGAAVRRSLSGHGARAMSWSRTTMTGTWSESGSACGDRRNCSSTRSP